MSGSLGGGKSSSTQNPDQVWGAQSPYLTDLYSQAQTTAGGQGGTQFAQGIQNPAMQAFNQQSQGGFSPDTAGLQQIAQGGGYDPTQQNAALGGAIDAGLGQISRNFNRNIMPGINTGSAMSNTSGGSRQGIAQGLAASDANQQATDFVNQMQSQNFNQMQGRALDSQGQQMQAYQGLGQQSALQNQAQQNAMGQAGNMQNLGFNTQYGNLQNYGQLIGGPTVLGQGGQSNSWNLNSSASLF
ncbi:hypothetical protein DRQ25_13480 [Candidatus Fermentibacteria bacterium]|nr:MAG: hypothetical protein DRQ25_13480 [Candidatus Fermentibacteria bacterium]